MVFTLWSLYDRGVKIIWAQDYAGVDTLTANRSKRAPFAVLRKALTWAKKSGGANGMPWSIPRATLWKSRSPQPVLPTWQAARRCLRGSKSDFLVSSGSGEIVTTVARSLNGLKSI